jgi:SSS family solute:Na+ symporter
MYMLMHPFLFLASCFAMTHFPDLEDPNTVFMQVTTDPAAHWLVGIVAAGAGLSVILMLAVRALAIGGVVSRNLVPNVRPDRQNRISNFTVAAFLVLAGP